MFLSIAPLMVQAEESFNLPVLRLPFMKTAPCIDGEIKESEWGGAARMEGLCLHGSGTLTGGKTSFWVGCDNRKLYIAMISETAPGGKLLARVAPVKDGNSRAYLDDNVEFILNPTPDAPKEEKFIYPALINVTGAVYKQKYAAEHGGENWLGELEIINRIIGDRWHFECAIPLQSLGVNSSLEGKSFGVRICRNWKHTADAPDGKVSQWSPFGGPHVNTDTMPVITWDNSAPVVQNIQIINEAANKVKLKLSIHNPGTQALKVAADMQMRPRNSAHSNLTETIELMPNETRILELATPAMTDEIIYAWMKIGSPDGGKIYYLRDFNFSASRKEPFFVVSDSGVAHCFAAATGEIIWTERMGEHHASLVSAEGLVYFLSDTGTMRVVKPGPVYDCVARNELGEKTFASPALSQGRMFLRGDKHLFCIGTGR